MFIEPINNLHGALDVPAMMGKRRGAAQIATASPAGCAASYRHKQTCSFRNSLARCVQQANHASITYL
jgi:hypothetical protein